ncbi:hypothetical protein LTR97_000746 [Elasticomyces elasticus]|uniref:Uncharacterized protein n=1 Tax=Elasticomyces elasticus TaxID=574655 RepID=A0AAN7WDQ8_9PEZI|nr:hypothetical protein LTR97_000746 [Elasticomyces elasticus]
MRSVDDTKHSSSSTCYHELGGRNIEQCPGNHIIDLEFCINDELFQYKRRAYQSFFKHGVYSDNYYSTHRLWVSSNNLLSTSTLPPQQTTNEGYRAAAGYMLYPLGLLGGYLAVV